MRGAVALVTVDDGATNTLDLRVVKGLTEAVRTAKKEAAALVLAGRPGYYSSGLDLETVRHGGAPASDLLEQGVELVLNIVDYPRPFVVACTGHALGAGTHPMLCADVRIGAAGDFKIGMNELSVGLAPYSLAIEMARARLSQRHFTLACNTAKLYSPEGAVEAGFLDSVTTGDPVELACATADALVQQLNPRAFEVTRHVTRSTLAEPIIHTAGELFRLKSGHNVRGGGE